MLVDSSDDKALFFGLDWIAHHTSHQVNGGLHPLVLNLGIIVDKVSGSTDCTGNARIGRGLDNSQSKSMIIHCRGHSRGRNQKSIRIATVEGTP